MIETKGEGLSQLAKKTNEQAQQEAYLAAVLDGMANLCDQLSSEFVKPEFFKRKIDSQTVIMEYDITVKTSDHMISTETLDINDLLIIPTEADHWQTIMMKTSGLKLVKRTYLRNYELHHQSISAHFLNQNILVRNHEIVKPALKNVPVLKQEPQLFFGFNINKSECKPKKEIMVCEVDISFQYEENKLVIFNK